MRNGLRSSYLYLEFFYTRHKPVFIIEFRTIFR